MPATPSPGPSQAVLSSELPQDGLPGGRFGPSRAAPGGPGRSLRAPRRLRPAAAALESPGQGGNFGEGFVAQPKLRLRRRRGSVIVRQRARSLFVRLSWPNSEETWHGWHPPQRLGLCSVFKSALCSCDVRLFLGHKCHLQTSLLCKAALPTDTRISVENRL